MASNLLDVMHILLFCITTTGRNAATLTTFNLCDFQSLVKLVTLIYPWVLIVDFVKLLLNSYLVQ